MAREQKNQKEPENRPGELGSSEAVEIYPSQRGDARTKALNAVELALYLRWLIAKGILMSS